MAWQCDICGATVADGDTHICLNPYRGYEYKSPPQPKYDQLVVGGGTPRAYRNGIEVDPQTGTPLAVPAPKKRKNKG